MACLGPFSWSEHVRATGVVDQLMSFLRRVKFRPFLIAFITGSPETVARKIAATVRALGNDRFDLKYSSGTTSHEKMMKSIELYGTKVIPMVRDMLAEKEKAA